MTFKQKYFSIIPALILYLILFNSSCSEDNPVVPPPPDKEQFVKLSTLTVTCTEAFISVSANDTLLPLSITLSRDDSPVFSFNLTKNDTTIIDTNLSPGGSYHYNAAAVINGEEWTGEKLQVQTLAPTSHNFTWQKFMFGDGASSIFRDVAVIDENNIWAVGEVYLNDSLGNPDPMRYNLAVWDGNNWTIIRVPYYYQGEPFYNPIQAVYAFGPNDIWFGGNGVIHWDGNQYNPVPIPSSVWGPHHINKIWGTSSNDLYIIGNDGKIAHYQNGSWSKIESETDLPINDIYADVNTFRGDTEILCVASDAFLNTGVKVIKINDNNTTQFLNSAGLNWSIGSIWFSAGLKYYIVGSGLYEKTYKDTTTWSDLNSNGLITQYFMDYIRGNGLNDIVVAGAYGEVLHFNGLTWRSLKDAQTTLLNGSYFKISIKGKTVAIVGYDDGKGVILLGHHL